MTRREFWWVFGGLSGAFLFLAQIGVMAYGDRGDRDGSLGGGDFVLLGVTVAGYLALVAAAAWLESRYAVREEERS